MNPTSWVVILIENACPFGWWQTLKRIAVKFDAILQSLPKVSQIGVLYALK